MHSEEVQVGGATLEHSDCSGLKQTPSNRPPHQQHREMQLNKRLQLLNHALAHRLGSFQHRAEGLRGACVMCGFGVGQDCDF